MANQFYGLQYGVNILKVKAKTKKKNATITIAIPDDFADDLLKQLCCRKKEPFSELMLSWNDNRIKEGE